MCWGDCPPPAPPPPTAPPPQVTFLGEIRAPQLKAPCRLAVAPDGDIVVSDPKAKAVHVFRAGGRYRFRLDRVGEPLGVAVAGDGMIYVGDLGYGSVRRYDPMGNYVGTLASGLVMPADLAIDGETGVVYVSDSRTHQVRGFNALGTAVVTLGGLGSASGQLNFPTGVAFAPTAGTLYVVDHLNRRVETFDRAGAFVSSFAVSERPQGLAIDGQGRLYQVDAFQSRVEVRDPQGAHVSYLGTAGSTPGRMLVPLDAVVDGYNRLLVTSYATGAIVVYGLDDYTLPPPEVYPATVVVDPAVIFTAARGRWVVATVEVPARSAAEIDAATVRLNVGGVEIAPERASGTGDADGDGIPDVELYFSRLEVVAALPGDIAYRVGLTGKLRSGEPFEGFADVSVRYPPAPETTSQRGGRQ